MKEIPLTRGKVTLVDDEDFEWLNQWKWQAVKRQRKFYADGIVVIAGKHKHTYMHRLIAGAKVGEQTDHINGDGLDNRRCNLRVCTREQNQQNRRKKIVTSSRFKGVFRARGRNKWSAQVCSGGRAQHLGQFEDESDAARAYNKAAQKLYGDFAFQNDVGERS